MSKKLAVIVVCLMQLASVTVFYASPPQLTPALEPKIEVPKMPDVAIPKVSADKPPGFLKDFLEIIKKHAVKKPTKQNLRDSLATLNEYISILVVRHL